MPSHQIRNSVIEKYLLAGIREITGYIQSNEDEFVEMITKKSRAEVAGACVTASVNWSSHRLVSQAGRDYPAALQDNIEGKISDERFAKSRELRTEQKTLNAA
jgi:hypothetical protein